MNQMLVDGVIAQRLGELKQAVDSRLESLIAQRIQSDGEVAELASRVLNAGGKRLRPVLILLSYEAAGGKNSDDVFPLALAFEMIHTATLVHDDMNDNAGLRRGLPTLHESAGSVKALIAGDWLFVQGFGLGGQYSENVVELMASCCSNIAKSEFEQLDLVMDISTTPEQYYSVIEGKTAGPFASGCSAAAIIANAEKSVSDALYTFGMEIGLAFQLVDDLLDLSGDEQMGKKPGADVIEGKMTLPLIHSLTSLHGARRNELERVIRDFDESLTEELMHLLNESESIDYVRRLVDNHLNRAREALLVLPEGQARDILLEITTLTGQRTE